VYILYIKKILFSWFNLFAVAKHTFEKRLKSKIKLMDNNIKITHKFYVLFILYFIQ